MLTPLAPLSCNFTFTGTGSFAASGSHAGNAYGMGTGQTATSPAVTLSSLAQNYIFSIWTSAATAGTITLGISGAPTITYSGGNVWQYHEISIPIASLTSPLTFTFTSSQPVSIDDILFYPDAATATTATYDPVNHYKVAATNTNGVSSYFMNDTWGRMTFQMDQDKNIVLKKAYLTPANVQDFVPAMAISPTGTINPGTVLTFTATAGDACTTAANAYTWDFGDGTTPVNTTASVVHHTYATANTYTVQLTVNSAYFGSKTITQNVVVTPVNVPLHYTNYTTSLGDVDYVTLSQGGVTKYTISASAINSTTVLAGVYDIAVLMDKLDVQYDPVSGHGYQSVAILGTPATLCLNFVTGGLYTFNYTSVIAGAPSGITFEVNTSSCTATGSNGGGDN